MEGIKSRNGRSQETKRGSKEGRKERMKAKEGR